ncbi:hypothetical protein Y1Q_0022721 [Alligator mississippiensis]|uniref:Uncharacterized protein n=1 Tax=Alligator mississippiensis TaxID=8496 RepID=A0A151N4S9_ALLMI|nr:hypothetical protein Y1Q_0022721 [Alligator mississippiensis]
MGPQDASIGVSAFRSMSSPGQLQRGLVVGSGILVEDYREVRMLQHYRLPCTWPRNSRMPDPAHCMTSLGSRAALFPRANNQTVAAEACPPKTSSQGSQL